MGQVCTRTHYNAHSSMSFKVSGYAARSGMMSEWLESERNGMRFLNHLLCRPLRDLWTEDPPELKARAGAARWRPTIRFVLLCPDLLILPQPNVLTQRVLPLIKHTSTPQHCSPMTWPLFTHHDLGRLDYHHKGCLSYRRLDTSLSVCYDLSCHARRLHHSLPAHEGLTCTACTHCQHLGKPNQISAYLQCVLVAKCTFNQDYIVLCDVQ